jgi:hypothetical protein
MCARTGTSPHKEFTIALWSVRKPTTVLLVTEAVRGVLLCAVRFIATFDVLQPRATQSKFDVLT